MRRRNLIAKRKVNKNELLFKDQKSIHLEKFLEFPDKFKNEKLSNKWSELIKIRNICNISIEEKRASKEIGSSLEANLEIELSKKIFDQCRDIDFAELCITSAAEVLLNKNDGEEINVETTKAEGNKCNVCWKIRKGECERHGSLVN
mgnify:CR=1 FL=1